MLCPLASPLGLRAHGNQCRLVMNIEFLADIAAATDMVIRSAALGAPLATVFA
jgi:hypothetical protein